MISAGTDPGLTEAAHLFKRSGWCYLPTAEGGTGYDHAVTMARSRSILGPFETHPQKHLMTASFAPDAPVQRVGHGQYVETPDGQAHHTFLCGRALPGRFCPMGRETGLAQCVWRDDWLYLAEGGMVPPPDLPIAAWRLADAPNHRAFTTRLPPEFQWLRTPYPDRLFSLTGSALRLTGRESLGSWFKQPLVARRQQHFTYHAQTTVLADPPNWHRAAGLTTYYSRTKFHAALVTRDGDARVLQLVSCLGDWPGENLTFHGNTPLPDGPITLHVQVDGAQLQFLWSNGGPLSAVGPILDASVMSDKGGQGEHGSFTGAFVGMIAYDLTGQGWHADFTRFDYLPGAFVSA
jgi:xylan 1,4-beta-xylosidase